MRWRYMSHLNEFSKGFASVARTHSATFVNGLWSPMRMNVFYTIRVN